MKEEFGRDIADKVLLLTLDESISKSEKRHELVKQMNKMTYDELIIKLCDRLDNVSAFNTAPKHFIKRYKEETQFILDNLSGLSYIHIQIIQRIEEVLKQY